MFAFAAPYLLAGVLFFFVSDVLANTEIVNFAAAESVELSPALLALTATASGANSQGSNRKLLRRTTVQMWQGGTLRRLSRITGQHGQRECSGGELISFATAGSHRLPRRQRVTQCDV